MSVFTDPRNLRVAGVSLTALSAAIASVTHAQEVPPPIEEVQVLGRLQSGAESLAVERMDESVAVDVIGFEQISRIGDSTVAAALRRVPGLTLVDDKFVYVRGLGERYSSTLLNGAVVPSPDLSRSVVPLDIFPTSIVESLSVKKVYSADGPAHFGGGTVDIRTTGLPDGFVANVEVGIGQNSISRDDFMEHNGDDSLGADESRGMSDSLWRSIDTYRGDISVAGIRNEINRNGTMTPAEELAAAEAINRNLALELNRDNQISTDSAGIDHSIEGSIGNLFDAPWGMEFGAITTLKYEQESRNKNIVRRQTTQPEEFVTFEKQSTLTTNLTGSVALGLNVNSENKLETTHIFLRNTDNSVAQVDAFGNDGNKPLSGGESNRTTEFRFEERAMLVHQIHGEHELGYETLDQLGWDWLRVFEGLQINWFASDARSTTDLPNELSISSRGFYKGEEFVRSEFSAGSRADHRFTELEDSLDNEGIDVIYPWETGPAQWEFSLGGNNWKKVREYTQLQFSLDNDIAPGSSLFNQSISQFYSDRNIINPDNEYSIATVGSNNESYKAVQKVSAFYTNVDVTILEQYRINLGIRKEAYQLVPLPYNPLAYSQSSLVPNPNASEEEIARFFADSIYENEDTFGSLAFTYMASGFWAEDFQLRASFTQSTIRPDLREISEGTYIDPITGYRVSGNPDLEPSLLDHFDLRAEWFFAGGDNFTVSLFAKDIEKPIEFFQKAATGNTTALEVKNAESAELMGAEIEFLLSLDSVHDSLSPFFVQGNMTYLDHELVAGDDVDAPTNPVRGLQGASDYAVNMILGFDSDDGLHSATMSYNVFGERLFFAGRLGEPDAYEQPFNSLDLTYSYYPLEELTIKAKIKNLLGEDALIQREVSGRKVDAFTKEVGRSFSLDVKYDF